MDNCSNLHAHRDPVNKQHISCWELSRLERIQALFTGKVWLGVAMEFTQPPVWLSPESPFRKEMSRWERIQLWFDERKQAKKLAQLTKKAVK